MPKPKSYYEDLGVSPDATEEEIRQAYRRRAKSAHPDRKGGSNEAMSKVNRAAETLLDPKRRLNYDRIGEDRPTEIQAKAREKLVAAILNWMANHDEQFDMMAEVTKGLLDEQRAIDVQVIASRQFVKRLKKHLKKLKSKNPVILEMIKFQIHNVDVQANKSDDNLEILKAAIELSKDLKYEQAPQPAGQQSSGNFFIGSPYGR